MVEADSPSVRRQHRLAQKFPNSQVWSTFTQWGDSKSALKWLDTALRNRDLYLACTKVNPFVDPSLIEPRYHAIERALKFPN